MSLPEILAAHKRIAIVGGPSTGKTTLAAKVKDRPVVATDDTKYAPWGNQPGLLLDRIDGMDSFVVEGVQTARALRQGMRVDAIIVLETPHEQRTPGQAAMAKGHDKILADALALNPGVKVYRESDLS